MAFLSAKLAPAGIGEEDEGIGEDDEGIGEEEDAGTQDAAFALSKLSVLLDFFLSFLSRSFFFFASISASSFFFCRFLSSNSFWFCPVAKGLVEVTAGTESNVAVSSFTVTNLGDVFLGEERRVP